MRVEVLHFDDSGFRAACQSTLKPGQESKVSLARMAACEHSPIRSVRFMIRMIDIPTFVSVHLVRHKHGVEHFVESNRSDRGGNDEANRMTPVTHTMDINAQALITISRKRLCMQASPETRRTWLMVREAVRGACPEIADLMVPECVYRNGLCPELRVCQPGPARIGAAHSPWPGERA